MTSAKNKMQDSTPRAPTRTSSRATKTVVRYTDLDDAAFERALAAGATETTTSGRVSYAPKPTPAELFPLLHASLAHAPADEAAPVEELAGGVASLGLERGEGGGDGEGLGAEEGAETSSAATEQSESPLSGGKKRRGAKRSSHAAWQRANLRDATAGRAGADSADALR